MTLNKTQILMKTSNSSNNKEQCKNKQIEKNMITNLRTKISSKQR